MSEHNKQDDPLANDIAKRLAKEQFKPTKKKKEKSFNLQQKLMFLIALSIIMGVIISLMSVLR
ncbi:hypothetical protein DN452_07710 [Lactobacillus reuteri]|uniref:hypothetical protein n=1 Tax=Limosilactobacillus reuteri TaxID=1598 RepID=UPI00128C855B|nr:hypothetical protein [Limosilactobacillus reuteri]MQB80943.1 hypothetical protein [Limosilactobacillus reuteri]MQB87545.1 hypothetical protein [Limosilactobacillus reuteri]